MIRNLLQVGVQEGLLSGDTLVWVALKHLVQQIKSIRAQRHLVGQRLWLVLSCLALREKRQFFEARPVFFVGGAAGLENLLQLFFFVVASEEWLVVHNLREDAPD